jgi:hypothetical protein
VSLARTLPFLLIGAPIAVAGGACGRDETREGPPPLATSSLSKDAGPRDAGGAPVPDAALEASAGATTFKGKLDATTPVKFGGDPYCEYTMTFDNVEIEIAMLESGEVIGAQVKNHAVEVALPPCPHPPMAPSSQWFSLTTVTPTASGSTLAFEGAKTNQPVTSLVIDLTQVGVTYEASAGWKRTDLGPPFAWEVRAKVTLVAH